MSYKMNDACKFINCFNKKITSTNYYNQSP